MKRNFNLDTDGNKEQPKLKKQKKGKGGVTNETSASTENSLETGKFYNDAQKDKKKKAFKSKKLQQKKMMKENDEERQEIIQPDLPVKKSKEITEVTGCNDEALLGNGLFNMKKKKSLMKKEESKRKHKKLVEAILKLGETSDKNMDGNKIEDETDSRPNNSVNGEDETDSRPNNSVNGQPEKKKKKKKNEKATKENSGFEEHKDEEVKESREETDVNDTTSDEVIYTLLGHRPEKISTLNACQKRLVKLSLLRAAEMDETEEDSEKLSKMKQKHQKTFQEAVDRGVEKGFIYHIDSRNSRSKKFDDDSD